jgi:hypothetical protein
MERHPIRSSFRECTTRERNTEGSKERKERCNVMKIKAKKRKRMLSGISETN